MRPKAIMILLILSCFGYGMLNAQKLTLYEQIQQAEKIAVINSFMNDEDLTRDDVKSHKTNIAQHVYSTYKSNPALMPESYEELIEEITQELNEIFEVSSFFVSSNREFITEKTMFGEKNKVYEYEGSEIDLVATLNYACDYITSDPKPYKYDIKCYVGIQFFKVKGFKYPKNIGGISPRLIGEHQEFLESLTDIPRNEAGILEIDYFIENYPPDNYLEALREKIPSGIELYKTELENKALKKQKKRSKS